MATDYPRGVINGFKQGFHRLVVGDTFGIVAFYDAFYRFGEFDRAFFNHFVITDGIDYCRGGQSRQSG